MAKRNETNEALIALMDKDGFSHKFIAARLNCGVSTVYSYTCDSSAKRYRILPLLKLQYLNRKLKERKRKTANRLKQG